MSKYQTFVFESYSFDTDSKKLTLNYSLDGKVFFSEEYGFNFDFDDYNETALNRAIEALFFVAGVSYYKTFLPPEIIVKSGKISPSQAKFYEKTYQKGLGEYFYVNQLDPNTPIDFPVNSSKSEPVSAKSSGFLLAIGGGKDSLVSHDLLNKNFHENIETWSLNHEAQLKPLIDSIGEQHNYISRKIDEKLLNPDLLPGAINGHIPISAIFGCVGVIVAVLRGKQDVVMSNERSADESTLTYQGAEINHQYSKSSEFEADFQEFLLQDFGNSVRYYSLLRPLSEVQIAKYFVANSFDKYAEVFSSCNRAYVHGEKQLFWDGKCSKCAFIYLVFQPFLDEAKLNKLIGHNLLLDPELDQTYKQLLGLTEEKPLECIGEIAESRWAMNEAKQNYSELSKYTFDPVEKSQIFKLSDHKIPEEVANKINFNDFL